MELDPLQATNAKRQQRPFVLKPTELPLDGGTGSRGDSRPSPREAYHYGYTLKLPWPPTPAHSAAVGLAGALGFRLA